MRLSLVSCPIYLTPATNRVKPVRLHQVWRPAPTEPPEDDVFDHGDGQRTEATATATTAGDEAADSIDHGGPVSRITIRPHDPKTGEEIDKAEIIKGYEFERGQFVTFTKEELAALDVESSKTLDLEKFVVRAEIDPLYLDSAYYLYPDGELAGETLRVIGGAMAEAGVVGIGPLTLSRRERAVMVEPRGSGMALFTLRAAEEVRPAQFVGNAREVDAEMVAIAGAIIKQRLGEFDPNTYHDRYQEAMRGLIEAKLKGHPVKPKEVPAPAQVVDLMTALKRSLTKEPAPAKPASEAKAKRGRAAADRRQAALLLPLSGARNTKQQPARESVASTARRRKASR